jgi:hypothetical protein
VAREPERTFLVERYVPRLDERAASTLSSRLREAIRRLDDEGVALRWGGSFALADEETYLCIIAATQLDDVVQLCERVGFEHDHVVEVLPIDAPPTQAR